MKKGQKMNALLSMVQELSVREKKALADKLMQMLSVPMGSDRFKCSDMIAEKHTERPDCPHCKAKASLGFVTKKGLNRGAQRYYCKSCGKYFINTTNTAFEGTHKDADVWRKFIAYIIEGRSLAYCAEHCEIAYQTAFTWRHKILNVFSVHQNGTKMSGIIQMDEMLVPISYKGNHIKGKVGTRRIRKPGEDNGLPRDSYKRGSDNKSSSSKDKVCVCCMVEDHGKQYYGAVPGVGFMRPNMLDATVGKVVNKDSAFVLVDQYKVTANYLAENNYKFLTLLSNISDNPNDHKPEIHGNLHLQNVNSVHAHIRTFLKKYYGVSSKYLGNYIALYMWIQNMKAVQQGKRLHGVSLSRASVPGCYIKKTNIDARPAIPCSVA